MKLEIGDKVIKNPETWIPSEVDMFRGIGVGEIVEPPFELPEEEVDVRWPRGRYFCKAIELIKISS